MKSPETRSTKAQPGNPGKSPSTTLPHRDRRFKECGAISQNRRNTARNGNRTLDILHVATAVHLGARIFLSFDARQQNLALPAGLEPLG